MAYILRKIGNADNVAINYYEVDTERDMQEIDVANAPMGSSCYVINIGSTYTLNSSKEWKLVPTSGGETPSGGTDISLGLTAATVGQTIKVKTVDTDGKPTAWEAVDMASEGGAVSSVNGKTGAVELAADDVGLGNVDNTSDANKPISTATQTALNGKLDKTAVVDVTADAIKGQAADAKAVRDAINRVNSAIEAKQDHLTEQDKQEIVSTGMTTALWTDEEAQIIRGRLAMVKNGLDFGIVVAGAQYYLGECKTVSFALPDDAGPGDMITVIWYNGDTPATLSITGEMLDFNFVPSANTRSEINALYDGLYWAILGNEMAVPSEVTE